MVYPYREKPAPPKDTPQPSSAPAANSVQKDNQVAELSALLTECKRQLEDNRNADEILMANLEGYTDLIAETLTQSFVEAVKPALLEQKSQIDKMQVAINNLKDEVKSLKRIRGFKNFLIWLSIVCNIGIAGYLIYLLIKGVVL